MGIWTVSSSFRFVPFQLGMHIFTRCCTSFNVAPSLSLLWMSSLSLDGLFGVCSQELSDSQALCRNGTSKDVFLLLMFLSTTAVLSETGPFPRTKSKMNARSVPILPESQVAAICYLHKAGKSQGILRTGKNSRIKDCRTDFCESRNAKPESYAFSQMKQLKIQNERRARRR